MHSADFRVLSAMLKAGLKRKAKLDPVTHARRVALESETQAGRFCEAFLVWRRCRRKICRRRRACNGDRHACLKRALAVPAAADSGPSAASDPRDDAAQYSRSRTRGAPAHAA